MTRDEIMKLIKVIERTPWSWEHEHVTLAKVLRAMMERIDAAVKDVPHD